MTAKDPFDWLPYVEKALFDLDEIPMFGNTPNFPWEDFSKQIGDLLEIEDFSVTPGNANWSTGDDALRETGSGALCLHFSVLPLQGHVSFVISAKDTAAFICWTVEKKAHSEILLASQFISGLMDYVALEVLHRIQPLPIFDGFLLRLLQDGGAPSSRVLVQDIFLSAYGEKIMARLMIPENFRKHWNGKFLDRPKALSEKEKGDLEISCSLEAAKILLTRKEWGETRPGDFLMIDNCHVDPDEKSGSVYITIGNRPLYRARIKNRGLKILEQPIYEEEAVSMDRDMDILDKHSTQTEEPIEEGSSEGIEVKEEKIDLSTLHDLPMQVTVELARFKMTYEKLLHLRPGNLLELNVPLDRPVNLVVGGQKIASAELVRVGEVLGVRILERN